MKWTKRTVALLAALLLLAIAAQAKGPSKASPRAGEAASLIREEPAGEQLRKIPVLPVLPKTEEDVTVKTLREEQNASAPRFSTLEPEPSDAKPAAPAQTADPKPAGTETAPAPSSQEHAPEDPSAPKKELLFPEAEDWQILLVNPWNEMPEDYEVTLKSLDNGMKVDERAYDSLMAMLQACREAGLAPKVCSAYRTQSKQTYLYNNKIARLRNAGYSKAAAEKEAGRWVARPGTSEHQLGLALDIVSTSYQSLTKKQEKTAEQKWLMEHCWEYGFILRYPNEKSEITGIGYEPWHYRYVGLDVALDLRDSGLCLEEYLLLREEALAEKDWM